MAERTELETMIDDYQVWASQSWTMIRSGATTQTEHDEKQSDWLWDIGTLAVEVIGR